MVKDVVARATSTIEPQGTLIRTLQPLCRNWVLNVSKCQDGGAGADSGRRRIGGIAASALWLSQVWERHFSFVRPSLTLASP